jgi:hypothetical protein
MALFGVGNLLLKLKRKKLPRPVRAKGIVVVIAILFIIAAFWGNVRMNIESFYTFIDYLLPTLLFIILMLNRAFIVKLMIETLEYLYRPLRKMIIVSNHYLLNLHTKINSQEFVFFTKGDNVAILNRVMQYVEDNETTRKLKIVNIKSKEESNASLQVDIEVLDRAYPDIAIEFIEIIGVFGPQIIEELSQKWGIPKNFMFIGSPGDRFSYKVAELGGVRLIM